MCLEDAIAANTAAIKELIEAIRNTGGLPGVSSDAASSPAVKAVVAAQEKAETKKPKPEEKAIDSPQSGEPSALIPTKSSDAPLREWAPRTMDLNDSLVGKAATLENLRAAILGINQHIGRAQAEAVLQRFGAQGITPRNGKPGLDESQYEDVFALCLDVLAGRADATEVVQP